MSSMLFISQQLPWPRNSGGNIRTYYLLKALAGRFDISLVTSSKNDQETAVGRDVLSEFCETIEVVEDKKRETALSLTASVVSSLVGRVPAFVQHNLSPHMRRAVRALGRSTRFDVVHLNHIDTAPYVDLAPRTPFVVDTHNLMYQYFARRAALDKSPPKKLLYRFESSRLKSYETRMFRRADKVLVCSDTEKESLAALDATLDVTVIPNGVDCDYFAPVDTDPADLPPNLVFVGEMSYLPNHDGIVEFIRDVLPAVTERVPGARLIVVGKNPRPELRELVAGRSDVELTGFVEDTRDFVRQARVFVVPLRYGAGTRLKILEAFSSGIPTVSTRIGAEGIEYRDGEDILIADEPGLMGDAVCELLGNRELFLRLRANGRKRALATYDWKKIGRDLSEFYEWLE